MVDAETLRRIALSLEGTMETPHFDRIAFKVKRIYATIAADRLTANIRFSPDDQQIKCEMLPHAFALPNAWGAQGWTVATLSMLNEADLRAALELAWQHAGPGKRRS
ncbi:MmcQ/YjbR family DNA-binding protein [Rhizobium sp. XQZ8]|uniref:MmcQ/YjbR family DNA-binding protein n=1 Tax=Rhizobium populisoli TaxID=2859785 RepID=UPI001CA55B39|nr:MmcQ/YjbR family DNA-binding protein [Rhizobium populisoli]MBW6420002.1 MmcQ/YjbR family DNA-binding protein [Rhizobium populisoli]